MFGLRIEFVVEMFGVGDEMSFGASFYLLRCEHIRNSLRRRLSDSLSNHRRLPTEGCTGPFHCKCTHQPSMLLRLCIIQTMIQFKYLQKTTNEFEFWDELKSFFV